jgi:hypothetical protein
MKPKKPYLDQTHQDLFGTTEEQKEKNLLNDLGIDYSDLDESGDMLEELKEIAGFYDN